MARQRPRRDRGTGSVFTRTVTTPQGKTITRHVGVLNIGEPGGKRQRKTVYGKSRQDVLEKLDKLRREMAANGGLPTSDPTVEQWMTKWLEKMAYQRVKPTTIAGYRSKTNEWIIPQLGKHKMSKLKPDHIRGMHQAMFAAKKSSTQVNGVHRVLSSALSDAVREEIAGRNVAKIVRAPSVAESSAQWLDFTQALAVLATAADQRLGTMWLTALLTGLRQGERLGLRWSCVDLDEGLLDVAWAQARVEWRHGCKRDCGKKPHYCPDRLLDLRDGYDYLPLESNLILQRPKTERSRRIIPMPQMLTDALARRYEAVKTERQFYEVDYDLVWCQIDGAPIRGRVAWQMWRDLCAEADVPTMRDHDMRHTAATLLQELGVDEHTIMAILGHSTAVQDRAYRHVSTDAARKALTDLGQRLALT